MTKEQQLEEFFKIKTYAEYDRRRHEFRELKFTDPGVREHMEKLNPPKADPGIVDGCIMDVFIKKEMDK